MIKLTLTNEQARIVARACDLYARIKIGQFNEIASMLMKDCTGTTDFARKANAKVFLNIARNLIYPDLTAAEHSYGFEKFADADFAHYVQQVISHEMGAKTEPVSSYPLMGCKLIKNPKKKKEKASVCPYNDGITCPENGRNCGKCGWNNGKA